MVACQTELFCSHCGTVTAHTIHYTSLYIKRIVCEGCHAQAEKSVTTLLHQYTSDLPRRAFALSSRLKQEVVAHPMLFASRLPRRVISKPIELSLELGEICLPSMPRAWLLARHHGAGHHNAP